MAIAVSKKTTKTPGNMIEARSIAQINATERERKKYAI
jgi:hypothetical protein